ncbi:NAD(P)-binding oxidoreductase [Apilactobacillus kunkeei]|uniref:NAD(P)-binding domain-containing protein n=1 Tax=Apilactobacillus kunkeei TaxID=148814 RepID=A0A0P7KT48_9LACO|nr:NAD(P)-binding oxidoreductase [Apilactobacillus kunkeei]KPN79465.1 hypothetical protein RZ78_02200 [Apilactobacillus kunkeei]
MKKVLIIGNFHQLGKKVYDKLSNQYEVNLLDGIDFEDVSAYADNLTGVNVIYTFLGPLDVDLQIGAVIQALDRVNPPLDQFIMLSTAGIDNELTEEVTYPDVDNNKEYLNQQRYAVKLVDEYEIPYTILRPVEIVDEQTGELDVIDEGISMQYGRVSADNVANTAVKVVEYQQFINQSIGLIER